MHFTKYLILLVALCGMAQAQIIKSNVFVRTDVTNETDKAAARALLGISEWVTNSVPSYTNIVADLTALAAYSGAEDSVLVSDANTGGTFTRETAVTSDGVLIVTNAASGDVFRRQHGGPILAEWFGLASGTDNATAIANTAALNAALSFASRNRWTVVLRGDSNYRFDLGIVVPDNTTLDGRFALMTFQNASELSTVRGVPAITIGSQSTVRNLNIYGSGVDEATCIKDRTGWDTRFIIDNVMIRSTWRIGVDIAGATPALHNIFLSAGSVIPLRMNLASVCDVQGFTAINNRIVDLEKTNFIASVARTTNVVTVTTGAAHDLIPGQRVRMTNIIDASLNIDGYVRTTADDTTFTMYSVGSDVVANPAESGTLIERPAGVVGHNVVTGNFDGVNVEGATTNALPDFVIMSDAQNNFSTWKNWWTEEFEKTFTLLGGTHIITRGNDIKDIVMDVRPGARVQGLEGWYPTPSNEVLGKAKYLYYFNEGVGSNVVDHAGNYDLPIAVNSAWTNTPYGPALQMQTASKVAQTAATIPAALVADSSWAVAWCWYAPALSAGNNGMQAAFRLYESSSHYLFVGPYSSSKIYILSRALQNMSRNIMSDNYHTGWQWHALVHDADHGTMTYLQLQDESGVTEWSWKGGSYFTPSTNVPLNFNYSSSASTAPWQTCYTFFGVWTNTIDRTDLKWLASNLSLLRAGAPKTSTFAHVLKPATAAVQAGSGEAVLSAGAYGSKTTLYVSQDGGVTQPIELRQRSSITTSRGSLAGEMMNSSAIAGCESGWTLSNPAATNWILGGTSYAYLNNGDGNGGVAITNTMQAPIRGGDTAWNRVYDVTVTLASACTITNNATIEVSLGGNVIGQIETTTSSFSATALCGSATNLIFTIRSPTTNSQVLIEFDTVSVVPWASGDLMHSHSYSAASLVPSASAAPYFEFSASGSNAATADVKTNILALATTTVTDVPEIIGQIVTGDNGGNWVVRGKVFATASDDYALELTYIDPTTTTNIVTATTDLTRWAWANAGYIYFGARDDSADSGVTIKASSVEIKP